MDYGTGSGSGSANGSGEGYGSGSANGDYYGSGGGIGYSYEGECGDETGNGYGHGNGCGDGYNYDDDYATHFDEGEIMNDYDYSKGSENSGFGEGMIGKYVVVRTYSAGCFAGVLDSRNGREAMLSNARRLWYWSGANSLSELALKGPSRPDECKFAVPVTVLVTEVIEVIDATSGRAAIEAVPEWTVSGI